MSRGRQDAGPEWCAICEQVRRELVKVCPMENRRFTRLPGTFSRQWVAWRSGVSLANIRRMMDEKLPSSPDTVTRLAEFLGMKVRIDRTRPLPKPPTNMDEMVPDLRHTSNRSVRRRKRNSIVVRSRATARARAKRRA